jgi:hypothetical protein
MPQLSEHRPQKLIDRAEKFWKDMEALYDEAGSLRDHASGKDKDLYNKTRGALYDLRDLAREQYYKWKES